MTKTNPYPQEFKNEVLAYMASTNEPLRAVAAHFGVTGESTPNYRPKANTSGRNEWRV